MRYRRRQSSHGAVRLARDPLPGAGRGAPSRRRDRRDAPGVAGRHDGCATDVDSHLMEPFDWLETRFPELAAELPPVDVIAEMLQVSQDDMMDALPASIRRQASGADGDVVLQAPVFVLLQQLRSMNREQALDLASDLHGVDAVIAQK